MSAFGKPDARGEWPYDPREVFTEDELGQARRLRAQVSAASDIRRRDRCPHTPMCPNVRVCLDEIAWYVRHQREIEAAG